MNQTELNELDALLKEVQTMTTGDLLDYLSPDTIRAIQADLDNRPPLTAEEQAFFDAEHDMTCAIQKTAEASHKALHSWDATDLADATFRFECAHAAARKLGQAEVQMNKAFRLTDEYKAQQAEKEGNE